MSALSSSRGGLIQAQDGIQAMQDEIAHAVRRVEAVDWTQRGGQWPPAGNRRALLVEFATLCESAAAEGEDVRRRVGDSRRLLTVGRREVEKIEPRTEQEQEEQARLRRTATALHRSLEEARVELERTQAALRRSAAAARESAPSGGRVEAVHTDLLQRTLRAAATEGHRVDEVVSRVSSQAGTSPRVDITARAARERMRAHRDLPGGTAGPPAQGIER